MGSLALAAAASLVWPVDVYATDIADAGTATSLGKNRARGAEDRPRRVPDGADAPDLWDNGPPNGVNGYSNATAGVFGARRSLLDDFDVPEGGWTLQSLRWNSVWGSGVPNQGVGAEISIRSDLAGTPGATIAVASLTGYGEDATGNIYFSREEVSQWAEFDDIILDAGHYWFEAVVQGPENNFWLTADQQGAECWVNYEDQGGLQPGSTFFGAASDINWSLGGVGGSCDPSVFVTDPGFESNPLLNYQDVLNDFVTNQGHWGAEVGAIVGAENGVTPFDGSKMLRMTTDGLVVTQTVQVIDVSALALMIDGGTLSAEFAARFNAHPNISAASAYPMLRFFTAANYGSLTSSVGNSFTLDADPATWERRAANSNIPAGTRWIVVEVGYDNATIGSLPGYVDAASLCIREIGGSSPTCRVYWTRGGAGGQALTSAAYDGANASTFRTPSGNLKGDIAFHRSSSGIPSSVCWPEGALIYRDAAYAPGTPTVVGADPCPAEYSYVAASATDLYIGCETSLQIYKIPLLGGVATLLSSSLPDINGLAFHGGTLYAATINKIWTWNGSSWVLFATIPDLSGSTAVVWSMDFDVPTGDLYVLGKYSSHFNPDRPFIVSIDSFGTVFPFLLNTPSGGGPVGYLQSSHHGIAVDGATGFVWWTSSDGALRHEVRRISLTGATPIVIATSNVGEGFDGITVSGCAPAVLGDVDGDGDVDFTDLLAILSNWGPCGAPCPADLDGDGLVSFADLLIVLANWG